MSYDHWKTTEPDPWEHESGQCDCCGKTARITRCWAYGIETWACDECQDHEPEEEDE